MITVWSLALNLLYNTPACSHPFPHLIFIFPVVFPHWAPLYYLAQEFVLPAKWSECIQPLLWACSDFLKIISVEWCWLWVTRALASYLPLIIFHDFPPPLSHELYPRDCWELCVFPRLSHSPSFTKDRRAFKAALPWGVFAVRPCLNLLVFRSLHQPTCECSSL